MKIREVIFYLCCMSLLFSCAHVKQDAAKETSNETSTTSAANSASSAPFDSSAVKGPPKYYHPLTDDNNADKPDSLGIIRGRYYGDDVGVLLGRSIGWIIENGWDILNDGAGANGTVVAKGKLARFQRLRLNADKKMVADYPCADCGRDSSGNDILCEEGTMIIKVKNIGYAKTKVTVDFTPTSPNLTPKPQCRSNGKLEQIVLNKLLLPRE